MHLHHVRPRAGALLSAPLQILRAQSREIVAAEPDLVIGSAAVRGGLWEALG